MTNLAQELTKYAVYRPSVYVCLPAKGRLDENRDVKCGAFRKAEIKEFSEGLKAAEVEKAKLQALRDEKLRTALAGRPRKPIARIRLTDPEPIRRTNLTLIWSNPNTPQCEDRVRPSSR